MVWRPVAIARSPLRDKGRLLDVVAVVGLVGLGALCWWLHIVTAGRAPIRGCSGAGSCSPAWPRCCVIAAVTHRRSLAGPLLGSSVLLWIGIRSYGLYLYHWPIYQIDARGRRAAAVGRPVRRRAGHHGGRHRGVVPDHRDADPAGHVRALVAPPAGRTRSRAAARHRRRRGLPRRRVGVRRGDAGDRRAEAERDRRSRSRRAPTPTPISRSSSARPTTDVRRRPTDGVDAPTATAATTVPPASCRRRRAVADDVDDARPRRRRCRPAHRPRWRSATRSCSAPPTSSPSRGIVVSAEVSRQMKSMVPVVQQLRDAGPARRRRRRPPRDQRRPQRRHHQRVLQRPVGRARRWSCSP